MIYFDNASTSYPKPEEVGKAVYRFITSIGGSPGRSAHKLSLQAGRIVYNTRELVSSLFGIEDPLSVIFTLNATMALNIAIKGLLKTGDRVVTTPFEHNSVLRPLNSLKGVKVNFIKGNRDGEVDLDHFKKLIKEKTSLVIALAVSNVTGVILPFNEMGMLCRERGIPFLLDASQGGGVIPLDVKKDNISILAMSGHKGLYGPQGTGILHIGEGIKLTPLIEGGTGSFSDNITQPEEFPDRFESGTLNAAGIAGLKAGVSFVLKKGIETIQRKEKGLMNYLLAKLKEMEDVAIYGPKDAQKVAGVLSFRIKGIEPSKTAFLLDRKYGIMVRSGLHCAPYAHRTIGTFPEGTVRVSFGVFNTFDEIDRLVFAVGKIIKQNRRLKV